MRGAVFWEPGRPLTLEDFRMPRPKAGELLIKTKGRIIAAIYRLLLLLRFFLSLFPRIIEADAGSIFCAACGVCHSDLHVLKGELPFSSPCVVGHEITGEVVDHGTHTPAEIINRYTNVTELVV